MSGIIDLNLQAETNDIQCQYVYLFTNQETSIIYLNSIMDSTHSFISFVNKEDYFSVLKKENQLKHQSYLIKYCKNIWFLDKFTSQSTIQIDQLVNEFKNIIFPKQSNLIISIPENHFYNLNDQQMLSFFKNTSNWAKTDSICLKIIIYGNKISNAIKNKLMGLNQYVSGVCTFNAINKERYDYHISFWCNQHGVSSDKTYRLKINNENHFIALKENISSSGVYPRYHDEERIYVTATALDKEITLNKNVNIINSNEELFTLLETISIQASTIILSYQKISELESISRQCYLLRKSKGNAIKIIIREITSVLRYIDEKRLLNAGVNFIIPFNVSFSRCVSLVESIQGQIFTRNLPDSADELLKLNHHFDQKGYIPNTDFKDYCSKIMIIAEQESIRFALIRLSLLSSMKAIHCLNLCHIHRDGDIVTACDHALYVFFSAIRLNDVHATLNQLFDIPIESLFLSYTIIDNVIDIKTELPVIIKRTEKIKIGKLLKQNTHHSEIQKDPVRFSINKPLTLN
ncbi:cellulose biosynthesis protein BcsE [uncultured Shewanella sp.]|uniref:cellulose biosynthesis protein BcsE n=1 Tax=uncultured Shewanella sp. TaxID=173975 RepID=UPI0026133FBE|nr:cellulose biosynthesis protein BcsE [uncultured Shewanella sp.]